VEKSKHISRQPYSASHFGVSLPVCVHLFYERRIEIRILRGEVPLLCVRGSLN